MEQLSFGSFDEWGPFYHQAVEDISRVVPVLLEDYQDAGIGPDDLSAILRIQLPLVLYATLGELKDKVVLDIGCGSDPPVGSSSNQYKPWLCRALHVLGARPVGVDIGPLDREPYLVKSCDVFTYDSLGFLPYGSVDVANVRLLEESVGFGYHNFESLVVPQLERIVKPSGYLIEH